jgi:hypothetical protein
MRGHQVRRLVAAIACGFVVAVALSGCGGTGSKLVGRWTLSRGEGVPEIQFFSGDTVTMGTTAGKYKLADDTHLVIDDKAYYVAWEQNGDMFLSDDPVVIQNQGGGANFDSHNWLYTKAK